MGNWLTAQSKDGNYRCGKLIQMAISVALSLSVSGEKASAGKRARITAFDAQGERGGISYFL